MTTSGERRQIHDRAINKFKIIYAEKCSEFDLGLQSHLTWLDEILPETLKSFNSNTVGLPATPSAKKARSTQIKSRTFDNSVPFFKNFTAQTPASNGNFFFNSTPASVVSKFRDASGSAVRNPSEASAPQSAVRRSLRINKNALEDGFKTPLSRGSQWMSDVSTSRNDSMLSDSMRVSELDVSANDERASYGYRKRMVAKQDADAAGLVRKSSRLRVKDKKAAEEAEKAAKAKKERDDRERQEAEQHERDEYERREREARDKRQRDERDRLQLEREQAEQRRRDEDERLRREQKEREDRLQQQMAEEQARMAQEQAARDARAEERLAREDAERREFELQEAEASIIEEPPAASVSLLEPQVTATLDDDAIPYEEIPASVPVFFAPKNFQDELGERLKRIREKSEAKRSSAPDVSAPVLLQSSDGGMKRPFTPIAYQDVPEVSPPLSDRPVTPASVALGAPRAASIQQTRASTPRPRTPAILMSTPAQAVTAATVVDRMASPDRVGTPSASEAASEPLSLGASGSPVDAASSQDYNVSGLSGSDAASDATARGSAACCPTAASTATSSWRRRRSGCRAASGATSSCGVGGCVRAA
eukprot:TRINITY_DN886_c1_g1_i1.p1 TRINITY_DN886_c1_g1~~TRINITY_DN886_c1_g1_i1.p1  ORF type:complete len:594 (-),score=139.68 TRINITY_DN886_c1_g1_i1:1810-3591(-)